MSANSIEDSENYHSLIVLSPLLLSHGPDMCVIGEDRLPGPGAVVLTVCNVASPCWGVEARRSLHSINPSITR